ncbi:hypothetical protein Hanom_Chr13g01198941 [Helianthus anomalus]
MMYPVLSWRTNKNAWHNHQVDNSVTITRLVPPMFGTTTLHQSPKLVMVYCGHVLMRQDETPNPRTNTNTHKK